MIAAVTLIGLIEDRATNPPMTGEDAIAEATAKLESTPEIKKLIGGVVADAVRGADTRMAKNDRTEFFWGAGNNRSALALLGCPASSRIPEFGEV